MHHAELDSAPTGRPVRTTSVAAFLRAVREGARRRFKIRRDLRQLRQLPDHVLDDVGLTRSSIERACRTGKG